MAELAFCYMTAGSMKEAEKIAGMLIEKRLAACVNILGGARSCFRWKSGIDRSKEVVLTAKTRRSLLEKLVAEVKKIHSYETPCIVAMPVVGGNKDFLEWIENETEQENTGR